MTTTLPLVRAAAIAPLMVWLRDSGYPLDQMLLDAGLPAGLIEDRDRPIPLMAGIRLLMEVVAREGQDVPCRMVAHAGIEELGLLGQIVMSSRTPREAFTKVERAKDFAHLYFRVEDIEAACARVRELGGTAALPSQSATGLSVAVCDDQGVSFSLWQPAPGY